MQHGGVAKEAFAKIKSRVIADHFYEALMGRFVEAKLLVQFLDELLVETLRASVAGVGRLHLRRAHICAAAAEAACGARIHALQLRHDSLDRTARRELDDGERDQQNPEQRRDHQEDAS